MANQKAKQAKPARATADGYAGRLVLARLALFWERLWPALWPTIGVVGLFLIVALFDLLPLLPGFVHAAVLAAFAAALGYALWHARGGLSWPGKAAAEHRIEDASGLTDRPLVALRDGLAAGGGDAFAEGLWRVHRARMLARIGALRVGAPHPGLAARDPWALRGAVLLLLVVALIAAGGDGPQRLARAANPDFTPSGQSAVASLELWITPPGHTGRAPIFLDRGEATDDVLSIPVTSTVLARLHGKGATPSLRLGEGETPFTPLDAESYQADATIESDGRLAVRRDGANLAVWDLVVIPDNAPIIVFALPPGASKREHLKLAYFARDDYGVETVRVAIRRTGDDGEVIADTAPLELDLALPGIGMREIEATAYHDLTPHPWAGLPVVIELAAEDAIGQIGRSEPFATVLPARVFQHPVARAIVEQRRLLTVDDGDESRRKVAFALRELTARPMQFYDDKVVFLALITASARLVLSDDGTQVPAVQQLLWDTALRIEDGELSLAERDLRAAQEALMQALAENASDAEIEELIDALRAALDRYLQALAENMADNPTAMGEQAPMDPNAVMLEFEDLRDILEQARDLARSGARDAAKDLLAQFRDILENMQPAMGQQAGQQGEGSLNEMLRDLSDLIRQQRDLLDETFQRSQEEGKFGGDEREGRRGAQAQSDLRRQLGDLMRRFGERYGDIPNELGNAEGSMRQAEDALERGAAGQAVRPQADALDSMRAGGRMMARGQQGQAQGMDSGNRGLQRDPFGRPLPGFGRADTEDVDIPTMSDVQRAREVLDELRRRAGERSRPQDELDYIDRLLRRF
jgi:uncharacterized protein (TIGR02302 family)